MRVVRALLEEYVEPYELSDAGVNFIVARVMAIYGFSIFVWLLCLAYHGISLNEDVFDSIAESIKVAVVPAATFAIGYFFARERGREGICFEEFERAGSLGSVEVKEEATDPSAIARKEFERAGSLGSVEVKEEATDPSAIAWERGRPKRVK